MWYFSLIVFLNMCLCSWAEVDFLSQLFACYLGVDFHEIVALSGLPIRDEVSEFQKGDPGSILDIVNCLV